MAGGKPGRGSDQFPLRFPDGMREMIAEAAARNGRSMNAEIVARLQLTLDADGLPDSEKSLLSEAIATIEKQAKQTEYHTEVMKWVSEQQSLFIGLLEAVVASNGVVKPEFLEALKLLLSTRGKDPGFPQSPDGD